MHVISCATFSILMVAGARVILACRDMAKAEKAAHEIRIQTGNQEVTAKKLDLADTKSIKEFASNFLKGMSQAHCFLGVCVYVCTLGKMIPDYICLKIQ